MNPIRALEFFLLKVLALGLLIGYFIQYVIATKVPAAIAERPSVAGIAVAFVMLVVQNTIIYPRFLDPMRHIPISSITDRGQMIFESPRGKTPLKMMKEYPDAPLIKLRGGPAAIGYLVSGPEALRDILNTNVYDFEKPFELRQFLARSIGFGLILSEGADHKKQRKALVPAFHIRRIRELYPLMWEKTQILLNGLEDDCSKHQVGSDGFGVLEIGEWASKLTLDIIGPTAMGRDFKSLTSEDNPIADAFLELLRPSRDRLAFFGLHFILPAYIVKLLPLKNNRTLNAIGDFLRSTCKEIVEENKQKLAKKDTPLSEWDILSRIMQTGEFTDQELMDQMLTFLAAGHETTASALTWVCYLCAKYPEVQKKLRAEIHEKIPSSSSHVSWDLLESMPYLNGVCEETQRLYPTVPTTIREAVRDTHVAGNVVPKGRVFMLVPYAINRHPRFWGDNADMIVPERWIDTAPDGSQRPNKTGGTSTNFSELTFLHGPRSCIGRDFAKAELRCAVAGVIGKFEIQLNTQEEPRVSGVITMKPEGGMYLRFKPIEW